MKCPFLSIWHNLVGTGNRALKLMAAGQQLMTTWEMAGIHLSDTWPMAEIPSDQRMAITSPR